MQCECCQEHEASIHLTQVINGQAKELHLCEACAEQHGLNLQGVMALPDVLFGMGGAAPEKGQPEKTCPHCHFRRTDFKKTGRLGCPRCYVTFMEELGSMLAGLHKGTQHVGKTPARARRALDIEARRAALQQELAEAVQAEQYERAAQVRDQMRELGG